MQCCNVGGGWWMVENVVRATLTNKKRIYFTGHVKNNGRQGTKLLTAPFRTKFLDFLRSVGE